MPVVNTTSPTACVSAAQVSPSKRVPSSSNTYASREDIKRPASRLYWSRERASRASDDQSLHLLELGCARPLQELEQNRLDSTHDRAGTLQALQAALIVELMARADGVGRHMDFDALVEQIVHGL